MSTRKLIQQDCKCIWSTPAALYILLNNMLAVHCRILELYFEDTLNQCSSSLSTIAQSDEQRYVRHFYSNIVEATTYILLIWKVWRCSQNRTKIEFSSVTILEILILSQTRLLMYDYSFSLPAAGRVVHGSRKSDPWTTLAPGCFLFWIVEAFIHVW